MLKTNVRRPERCRAGKWAGGPQDPRNDIVVSSLSPFSLISLNHGARNSEIAHAHTQKAQERSVLFSSAVAEGMPRVVVAASGTSLH